MKQADFEDAFRKGLGRAWLHVRSLNGDDRTIREILKRGCIENFRYDRQCEGERSQWDYEILKMTADPSIYEKYIL